MMRWFLRLPCEGSSIFELLRIQRACLPTLALTLFLFAQGCREQTAEKRETTLRVVTWNIHGCAAGMAPIVNELRQLDADVICLQEAETGTAHAGGRDQAADIAQQLGMRYFAAGSSLPQGGEQRMAILFKKGLDSTAILDAETGRIYGVTATIRWQDRSIRIVSVHLTSSYRTEFAHVMKTSVARNREATDLAGRLADWAGDFIIAGDFNSTPGLPAYNRIAERATRSTSGEPTYPSNEPSLSIDHVFHSKELELQHAQVVHSPASDHLPTLVILRLKDSLRQPS